MKLFFTCILIACIVACGNIETKVTDLKIERGLPDKAINLESVVRFTDSVQVLFYNDPDGDPERYTRFYTHAEVKDSGFTATVLNSLDQSFQEYSRVKECRSEGKMYLFRQGADDPLQTIYFSTRCDSCCYVYLIKNGLFYYMNMTDDLSTQLKTLRSKSK